MVLSTGESGSVPLPLLRFPCRDSSLPSVCNVMGKAIRVDCRCVETYKHCVVNVLYKLCDTRHR